MFNIVILGIFAYFFYKKNIKTGKLKKFIRRLLPDVIHSLQNIMHKIDGTKNSHRSSNYMSIEEARQILGVKYDTSKNDILSAFKKLMLKNHPDKGGTEYIATKIIQAKNTLLKN